MPEEVSEAMRHPGLVPHFTGQKKMKVCPLGLCTFEEVCPKAPCVDCMHRLGQHMIGEMKVIGAQADHAQAQGDTEGERSLREILNTIGHAIGRGEDFRSVLGDGPAPLVNEH